VAVLHAKDLCRVAEAVIASPRAGQSADQAVPNAAALARRGVVMSSGAALVQEAVGNAKTPLSVQRLMALNRMCRMDLMTITHRCQEVGAEVRQLNSNTRRNSGIQFSRDCQCNSDPKKANAFRRCFPVRAWDRVAKWKIGFVRDELR